ncbi:MAG: EamA family transporter [Acidobacteriaceae bacterium]
MAFAIHENALIALTAAAFWGGGDFSGGMGVKASGGRVPAAIRFVILAHAISLVVLVSILWARHAGLPHGAAGLWSVAGGVTGALGVVAFYIALSRGGMGISAAVSGLLAAAIPAVVSSWMEGAPSGLRLAGFALAGGAIWMIAAGDSPESKGESRGTMALAIFAGLAFGVYFVALRMANPLGLVMPMAIARASSVTLCAVTLGVTALIGSGSRLQPRSEDPNPSTGSGQPLGHPMAGRWPAVLGWACAVALLDTSGNVLFMAATRLGRLDVASVLASLYPAGTILLAAWALHERPTRRQGLGMVAALAAVVMITL